MTQVKQPDCIQATQCEAVDARQAELTQAKKHGLVQARQAESANARHLELTAVVSIDCDAAAHVVDAAGAPQAGAGQDKPALPRFSMVAYTGGTMRITGWRHPLVVDLAGLAIPSQSRPIRFGHDASSGVGHTDSIRVEDGRLVAAGVVSRDTAAAKEIVASARNGFPWQASIGAAVEQFEFIKENQSVLVNGREFSGPVNVVRKATLGEISFVDLGADGNTSASVAATAATSDDISRENVNMEVSDTTTAEPTPAAASEAAPADAKAQAGTDAPSPSAQPAAAKVSAMADANIAADMVADLRARAAVEQERIAAVRKVCGERHADIAAKAIKEGWDVTRTELEVLRADRPKAPAVHVNDNTMTGTVLEAACMLSARLGDVEKLYDDKTLDAAGRRFRGGIGLQELMLEAAWANGYDGRNFRDSRAVLRFAFGQNIEAAFSNIDIGGILSNVANKFLLEGFFSVERTWRNICAVRNVSDFKTVTSYRLIGRDQYEIVAPGGEI